MNDTIAALSSGQPPAAIAVIRISGPDAYASATAIAGPLPPSRKVSLRTLRDPGSGQDLDRALVVRFSAAASATGEEIVEFQCHGGRAVVSAVLDALTSCPGVRPAQPGEFTRRALANGRLDLTEAEGLADLLEAETESQRRAALALSTGALSRQIEAWQSRVVDLSAQAEAAIDYVGDEDETAIDVDALSRKAGALAAELGEWLARPRTERLRDGIRVVIAGPVNAGKSSLINALAGQERAIVTPLPGTTRDAIEVPLAVEGVPLLLVDTAGVRETSDEVERIGVRRAQAEADGADILLWMGDPADAPVEGSIRLQSKADEKPSAIPGIDLLVSSRTGHNLDTLFHLIAERARNLLPREGQVALNRRQADLIAGARAALKDPESDILLLAEQLRQARSCLDRVTGQAGVEDMLDALFGRFCLGK